MRNEIGSRIGQLREEQGISQQQLAEALGVRRETVTQWENATRDLKTGYITKLAEFFGVSADYLLFLSEAPTRNETIQGICDETGLWVKAVTTLKVNKCCDDSEISEFISYLITDERLPRMIRAIKQRNQFSETQPGTIDIDGEDYEASMRSLFKVIINDLFWAIVDGYNVKSGDVMVCRREGESNG